mmetsp:Transcript_11449/g.32451  ORF Transcript_11449/g.32451 Transcript_11449/m.32451 type:complete len:378 (-) Transcript_11449:414-1547(-)
MNIGIMSERNGLLDADLAKRLEQSCMLRPGLLAILGLRLLLSVYLEVIERDGNGKGIDIGHTDMTDPEGGADVGPVERGAEGHTLIGVDVLTQLLLANDLAQLLLDAGDAHTAADQLDLVDLLHGQVSRRQGIGDGSGGTEEKVVADLLKGRAVEMGLVVGIVVEGIDENGEVGVGAENVLDLVGLDAELGHGAGEGADVLGLAVGALLVPDLVELVGHVIDDAGVEGHTAKGGIPRLGQDLEGTDGLALGGELGLLLLVRVILDDRHLESRGAHVVEEHVLGLLVNTVNAKVKGGGGILVNERQHVEVGQLGSIQQGLALVLREERGNRQDTIANVGSAEGIGNVLGMSEDHGHELLGGELDVVDGQADARSGFVV